MDTELVIDWFQFTIFSIRLDNTRVIYEPGCYQDNFDKIITKLFKELFDLDSNKLIKEPFGLNGYDVRYSYKDINIMLSTKREDMGVNVMLSGQGCRDFEELGITWQELFDRISKYDISFSRIDMAIDTFNNKYYTIELIKKYINNGLCCSKFRAGMEISKKKLTDSFILGNQVQFGSRASNIQITFYDKYKERENQGKIIDEKIKYWFRCELRFRHENANELFRMINHKDDYMNIIKSVLYNYIDFKSGKGNDSNKSRRPTVQWWKRYIDDLDKIQITNRSSEGTIVKKYNWILKSVSKAQFLVYLSKLPNIMLDTLSIDLLYEIVVKGSEGISDKDIMLVNDYRIKNKLDPISKSQALDYVQDIKDTILI